MFSSQLKTNPFTQLASVQDAGFTCPIPTMPRTELSLWKSTSSGLCFLESTLTLLQVTRAYPEPMEGPVFVARGNSPPPTAGRVVGIPRIWEKNSKQLPVSAPVSLTAEHCISLAGSPVPTGIRDQSLLTPNKISDLRTAGRGWKLLGLPAAFSLSLSSALMTLGLYSPCYRGVLYMLGPYRSPTSVL